MPLELTCPEGHHWQSLTDERSGSAAHDSCPVCGVAVSVAAGAPGTTIVTQTQVFSPPTIDPRLTPESQGDVATMQPAGEKTVRNLRAIATVVVPGYEVISELGRGGMGVVYKARQLGLNRIVALKMILAGAHAGDRERSRFRSEAEAVAKLHHPHIVQIHEIGEHEGNPYFSLEFVEGGSLEQQMASTPQSPRQAAVMCRQLAEAMDCAHQQGIVHRDLKPANVLLTPNGQPKITDFGLAKHLDVDTGHTREGAILGTPSYMAPEQAWGMAKEVGPAADVYALGAILYDMLTGRPPFKGEKPLDTLDQVRTEDPIPPTRLQPKIPRDLETICLKCLQKEAIKRYASALALAQDLGRFLQGEPILARPTPFWERAIKWVRRRPTIAALWAMSMLLVVLSFVGIAWGWRQSEQARRTERTLKEQAEDALARANASLYLNHIALAEREWTANHVGRVEQLLDDCPGWLRRWEWYYLKRLCHADQLTLKGHAGWVNAVAFHPNGKLIISASDDRSVKVWDAASGSEVRTMHTHAGPARCVAVDPKGHRIAAGTQDAQGADKPGVVKVWELETGKELFTFRDHQREVRAVAFSPDGRLLASASCDRTVRVWDLQTGQAIMTFKGHPHEVHGVAFHPEGKWIASADSGGRGKPPEVKVWDVTTGKERLSLPSAGESVTWSADGQRLATARGHARHSEPGRLVRGGEVKVWDAQTGQETLALRGEGDGVAFSPDGLRLALAGNDGMVHVWEATTGQEAFTLRGHRGRTITSVAFSPDGLRLASASDDRTVKVWDATTGPEARTLRGHAGEVRSVAFSLRGRRLASGSADGTVRIWETTTGKELAVLTGHLDAVDAVAFGTDGETLVSTSYDQTLRIWDIARGKIRSTLPRSIGWVRTIAACPIDRRLALGGYDGSIKIWDETAGQVVTTWQGHARGEVIHELAWSSDGVRLASAGADGTVRLWDVATGQEVHVCRGHSGGVRSVAFSPDGRLLASGGEDHTVRVWDAVTGAELRSCSGHSSEVWSVACSPDGSRLASAGLDMTIRIWDSSSGQELLTLRAHTAFVGCVTFDPDGQCLASGSADTTVRLWDAPRIAD